jgi:hypothetical protein
MDFKTKFSLGDRVCTIKSCPANHIVKCVTCNHTGKVLIGGEEFVCPKCEGKSSHPVYDGHKYFIGDENVLVGKVSVSATQERYLSRLERGKGDRVETEYMLNTTGVGSGTVWREHELFNSRQEAQAECDKRNLSLPVNEV